MFSILGSDGDKRADCTFVKEFSEPEYTRKPVFYSNLDEINSTFGSRMRAIFTLPNAAPPTRRIVKFDKGVVFDMGVVCLPDGLLVEETLQDNKYFRRGVAPIPLDGMPFEEGNFALLRKAGDVNYGHWLIELATRVLDFRRAELPDDTRFLVTKNPPSTMKIRAETLQIFGIPKDKIEWIDNDPRAFRNVYVCTPNSIHSHTHCRTNVLELRSLAQSHAATVDRPTAGYGEKIFIGRPKGHKRRALNEDEAFEECRKHGYVRFDPTGLSLVDQIKIFENVTHIVAVFGASLTNIIWARPGCRVVALTPDISVDYFFWDLATICDHKYSIIFGNSIDQTSNYVHQDFIANIQKLREYFERH